jgi:hypothetical protein
MSGEPTSQRAAGHVAAFKYRVRSGDLIAELTVTFD